MTHIERIRVDGFKAINNIELEPGRVNILTGRNNTGKTSLLESINLTFNPDSLSDFSGNLDKLINENDNSASINCEYNLEQRKLESFVKSDEVRSGNREVGIREPKNEEVLQYFNHIYNEILETNAGYPIRINQEFFTEMESTKKVNEYVQNTIQDSLHNATGNITEREIVESLNRDIIIAEIAGERYPFINLGAGFGSLRKKLVSEAISIILDDSGIRDFFDIEQMDDTEEIAGMFNRNLRRKLSPRFKGRSRFVYESPEKIPGVNFIIHPHASPSDIDLEKDKSAIRMDDIQDYLIEYNIIENLKDFSFHKLVFENNDEKDEVPYDFMGSGFKTIVGILWELTDDNKENSVLLLEEPDIHMHPGYVEVLVREIIRFAKEKNLQLFISTHSMDLIEAFVSPGMKASDDGFLEEEFRLFQMSGRAVRRLDYEETDEEINELHTDLRGI